MARNALAISDRPGAADLLRGRHRARLSERREAPAACEHDRPQRRDRPPAQGSGGALARVSRLRLDADVPPEPGADGDAVRGAARDRRADLTLLWRRGPLHAIDAGLAQST